MEALGAEVLTFDTTQTDAAAIAVDVLTEIGWKHDDG